MSDTSASQSTRLFLSTNERIQIEDALTRKLVAALGRARAGAVKPQFDIEAFHKGLATFDYATPRPLEDCIDWSISELETGIVHTTHPRYFGLFNPGPAFAAECAGRIVSAFNPQLAAWITSPAAVEIERHVIRAVGARAGLGSETAGHFTSGGSEANYTALVCALTVKEPRFADHGVIGYSGHPVFYVSTDSHLAWIKIAHAAGLGRKAARLVATDGSGRMDPAALRIAIETDRAAGCVPVMVAATAGTTVAGMIDPLAAIGDIAHHAGLWFHVDAAWGGALIASERLRGALAGLERTDSLTIDAHKWFATTMGCGMFISPHAHVLSAAFQVATGFMPSAEPSRDPYMTSLQWSRRFLGLRLFLSLASAGWRGYAAHVEHSVALAEQLEHRLRACGWRIVNASPLAVVCAVPTAEDRDVAAIVRRVVASGSAWISAPTYQGRTVLRACVTHGETMVADIDRLAATLALVSASK